MSVSVSSNGWNPLADITAAFTPKVGGTVITLTQAEQLGGFVGFNWVNTVTYIPSPSPYKDASGKTLVAPPSFSDPPAGGYEKPYPGGPADGFPFYYDAAQLADAESTGDALSRRTSGFVLTRWRGIGCGGKTAPPGSAIYYKTDLVGVLPGNKVGPALFEFTWKSNFNGTTQLSSTLSSDVPADFDSGFGGITILSETYSPMTVPEAPTWLLMFIGFLIVTFSSKRFPLLFVRRFARGCARGATATRLAASP